MSKITEAKAVADLGLMAIKQGAPEAVLASNGTSVFATGLKCGQKQAPIGL